MAQLSVCYEPEPSLGVLRVTTFTSWACTVSNSSPNIWVMTHDDLVLPESFPGTDQSYLSYLQMGLIGQMICVVEGFNILLRLGEPK